MSLATVLAHYPPSLHLPSFTAVVFAGVSISSLFRSLDWNVRSGFTRPHRAPSISLRNLWGRFPNAKSPGSSSATCTSTSSTLSCMSCFSTVVWPESLPDASFITTRTSLVKIQTPQPQPCLLGQTCRIWQVKQLSPIA